MNQPSSRRTVVNAAQPSSRTIATPSSASASASPGPCGRHTTQPLRQILQGLRPHYGNAMMEGFVQGVFSDPSVVDAYFFPKPMSGMRCAGESAASALPAWIPLEAASRAAAQAQMMALIKPFERRLTHIAAFLYPCGLFHCVRTEALSGQQNLIESPIPGFAQIEITRSLLLEEPLRHLKAQNPALANTLAAVLGLPSHDDDINQEQVARIASAVYLANVKVSAIWAPA